MERLGDGHGVLVGVVDRLDHRQRPVACNQQEEAGAHQTDQVQHRLKQLENFESHLLIRSCKTVKFDIRRQDGDTTEFGKNHQDEKSNPGIVDRLPGCLNFGEELDNTNRS